MSILDDARALQSRKRVDRLLTVKQKKIKGATYLGKDPIDGTDIVQVDGDEPVSGFRLISNKPISIGDRVSLRPSQGGLQRVDAPNVKPDDIAPELIDIEVILSNLKLTVNNPNPSANESLEVTGAGVVKRYRYTNGVFLSQTNYRASDFVSTGTLPTSFTANDDNIVIFDPFPPFLNGGIIEISKRLIRFTLEIKGTSAKDFIGQKIGENAISGSKFSPLFLIRNGSSLVFGAALPLSGDKIPSSLKIDCGIDFGSPSDAGNRNMGVGVGFKATRFEKPYRLF